MESNKRLVSIIMNCYNGERFLSVAINSILSQTYTNWEVIFWDNQSTDSSATIAKNYVNSKFRYFYSPHHTSLYKARNEAIKKAKGDFLAFLDVDDWWQSDKLERQIPLFKDAQVGIVYGNYFYHNQKKGVKRILYKDKLPRGFIAESLINKNRIGMLTLVLRREAYNDLLFGFNEEYDIIGDFDAVFRISQKWKSDTVDTPIANYRYHGDNLSSNSFDKYIEELGAWEDDFIRQGLEGCYNINARTELRVYLKALQYIQDKEKMRALALIFNTSVHNNILKVKIFILVFSPLWMHKYLRN